MRVRAYHERQKAGRLMTRMVNDVEVFSDLVADGVAGVLVALLTLAGALVAMFLVSALLAGLVLASVIPLIGGLAVLNRKILRAYAQTREPAWSLFETLAQPAIRSDPVAEIECVDIAFERHPRHVVMLECDTFVLERPGLALDVIDIPRHRGCLVGPGKLGLVNEEL